MDSIHGRTKKISLFLLVIIVLFIIALIFTIINIFSSANASSDSKNTNTNIKLSVNFKENNLVSEQNILKDLKNFEDINNFEESNSTIKLNNHTFTFDDSIEARLINDSNKLAIQISNSDSQIILNTDNSINYETIKSTPSLRDFLQKKYNITITSDVKSGKIQNLNLILFTISDNNNVAYFVITPLNDSEIIYSKIYNKSDMSSLIKDLSQPIDEISSIINNSIN